MDEATTTGVADQARTPEARGEWPSPLPGEVTFDPQLVLLVSCKCHVYPWLPVLARQYGSSWEPPVDQARRNLKLAFSGSLLFFLGNGLKVRTVC